MVLSQYSGQNPLYGKIGHLSDGKQYGNGQSERSRAEFIHFQASFEDLLHVILDLSHVQRIRDFLVMRYINVRFTYLLTISRTRKSHDYR